MLPATGEAYNTFYRLGDLNVGMAKLNICRCLGVATVSRAADDE
ncbi:MAG: hypothetical protein AAGB06_02880 [Verrucomicrobiota bacterium]